MKNPPDKNIVVTITSGTILRGILFALLIAGVYVFWDVVLVVLTAVVIASAVEPATVWFARRGVPRALGVLTMYVAVLMLFSIILYFFIPPILEETVALIRNLPQYIDTSPVLGPVKNGGLSMLAPFEGNGTPFPFADVINGLRDTLAGLSGGILNIVSTIFGGLMSAVLIAVLSFYLAVQEDGVANFLKIVTPLEHEEYVINLWKRAQFKIGRWMQGQLILALIIGVLVYLGLTILGVRYALLLALIAAMFELIPLFGPILAAIPATAIGFLDGGLTQGLLVVGLYTIIQQFENQLIHPLVVRKVVGVPPLMVILALIIGARLAGFLGLVLSVPIAAAFREYMDDLEKEKMAQGKKLASSE